MKDNSLFASFCYEVLYVKQAKTSLRLLEMPLFFALNQNGVQVYQHFHAQKLLDLVQHPACQNQQFLSWINPCHVRYNFWNGDRQELCNSTELPWKCRSRMPHSMQLSRIQARGTSSPSGINANRVIYVVICMSDMVSSMPISDIISLNDIIKTNTI